MALELGRDFSKRWLTAPEVVRQQVFSELTRICQLLQPETDFATWQLEQAKLPSLEQVMAEAIQQQSPLIATSRVASQPATASALPLALKKRFLLEADDLIEQALDPIRQHLRTWLHAEMQRIIAEQQPS